MAEQDLNWGIISFTLWKCLVNSLSSLSVFFPCFISACWFYFSFSFPSSPPHFQLPISLAQSLSFIQVSKSIQAPNPLKTLRVSFWVDLCLWSYCSSVGFLPSSSHMAAAPACGVFTIWYFLFFGFSLIFLTWEVWNL